MVTNGVLSLLEQSQRSFRILTNFCACRTPSFEDQLIEADNGLGEVMKPPEKSFWAKYVSNCTKYLLYFVKYLRVCVCIHVPSVGLVCFAVDVHHSAWSYCHECCYGSGQHTRGSCRAGPTWSRTGTCCCCREEKMMAASMFSHTVGIIIRLTIVTLFSVFLGMVSILP